jgi:putative acetyltransferase
MHVLTKLTKLAALSMVVAAVAAQTPDASFAPAIEKPTHRAGLGPKVAIDAAHLNFHTADAGYAPLAELLRRDGYRVGSNLESFGAQTLAGIDILVIANAMHRDSEADWAPQPPDMNSWAARLASVETLVAETHGKLAGFISYELNGHIDLLYTSPVYCRVGVASALLRQEAAIRGRGVSELSTEAGLIARPCFERFGFEVTDEQRVQRQGVTFLRYAMRKSLVAQQALPADAFKATRG